jgi:hypothetical protein
MGGLNLHVYAPSPIGWVDPNGLTTIYQKNWEAKHGPLPDGYQVHHIIPKDKETVALAKKICPDFDVHSADNLIALPKDSSKATHTGAGFGKTPHFGNHSAYSEAARYALNVAARFKKGGLAGCAKLKALQATLRSQLESGKLTMYGKHHSSGNTDVVQSEWENAIHNGIRGGGS